MNVTTLTGNGSDAWLDGTIAEATFQPPCAIAVNSRGDIFVGGKHHVRKISNGWVTTSAGTTTEGYNDGNGGNAHLNGIVHGIVVDSNDTVYFADYENHCIRKIDSHGNVVTFAGGITSGFAEGQSTNAKFSHPAGLAVDSEDNVYVADYGNHCIRKITPTGLVSTFAGTGTTAGCSDSQSPALLASTFNGPTDVAIDSNGNIFVTDYNNNKIRKITSDGMVSTYAGSSRGFAEGQGIQAQFDRPHGLTVDADGNLYVADYYNHKIRMVAADGMVSTIAGADAGCVDTTMVWTLTITDAELTQDVGVSVTQASHDAEGTLLTALTGINTTTVTITSALGQVFDTTADLVIGTERVNAADITLAESALVGFGNEAKFNFPIAIHIDSNGDLLIGDYSNFKVRKISMVGVNPIQMKLAPVGPSKHIQNFGMMLDDDDSFSDVEFLVGNEKVKAHRAVLAARNDYFKTMFTTGVGDPQMNSSGQRVETIQDTTMPALKFVLCYLYTDSLELTSEIAIEVLRLSHRYGITRLYNYCQRFCFREISNENVVLWFFQSDMHNLDDLRESTKRYLAVHFRQVRDEFPDTICQLEQRPNLYTELFMELKC